MTSLVAESAGVRGTAESRPIQRGHHVDGRGARRGDPRGLKVRLYAFCQGKMKVGVGGVDDRAAVRRIRRVLGTRFDLRIDANEAWRCRDLEARSRSLAAGDTPRSSSRCRTRKSTVWRGVAGGWACP